MIILEVNNCLLMRKLFANCAFLFIGLSSYSSFGQCTPDESVPGFGVYPAVLAEPCINTPYDETVTVAYPTDTTVNISNIDFNLSVSSVTVTSITGLPDGINDPCSSGCVFNPPALGDMGYSCLQLEGTPIESGLFDVTVNVTIAATGTVSTSLTESWTLQLQVNAVGEGDCTDNPTTGIIVNDNTYEVSPNPSNGVFNLEKVEASVVLSDSYGTVLSMFENVDRVDLTDFADGVYYLNIDNRMVRVIKN